MDHPTVPHLRGDLSMRAVWIALGSVVVVSTIASLLELSSARRAPVAEVMRGAE